MQPLSSSPLAGDPAEPAPVHGAAEGGAAGPDPFHPVLRVLDRYRHDVHHLAAPPSGEALSHAAAALGGPLPADLRRFLARWNGASLFRGALQVRAAAELAPVSAELPEVILFADGPGPEDRWAFAAHEGGVRYGRWIVPAQAREPGRFLPLHARFERWLAATVRILDENLRDPEAQLAARLQVDPTSVDLLVLDADRLAATGHEASARGRLMQAVELDPRHTAALARLGQALRAEDEVTARDALLAALRATRLPRPWPEEGAPGPELITALEAMLDLSDPAWDAELQRFLTENLSDCRSPAEGLLAEAAAQALARALCARGERAAAQRSLQAFLDRALSFSSPLDGHEANLQLVALLTELGHHDEAERRLRRLRDAKGSLGGRARLALGRLAVLRQEPWAEEILEEALAELAPRRRGEAPLDPGARAEAQVLLAERHRMKDRLDAAAALLTAAQDGVEAWADLEIRGQYALVAGDLARQQGDGPNAEAWYRHARGLAEGAPELLLRVLLRRGDLFRMTGDEERARADYGRAAAGFDELGLPLRQAWALLRLAALGEPGAADEARQLFKAADLAAGVAAADAIGGDPGRSIDWHLERAADHARDRVNAQRARPPLIRADADRPERRLGAHRMAVAACDVRVVSVLAAQLEQGARLLDNTVPRSSDPNLARYVAAADLLAGHRSYEAAEVLLRHLLQMQPDGPAGRALIAAMARSPNAALVDGLLDAASRHPDPSGVSAAVEVLGWRREPGAVEVLRKLLSGRASKVVKRAAIVALGRIGDPSVVDELLGSIDDGHLAGEASTALLLLGEWRGVDEQAQRLASRVRNAPRTLGEIVGRYGGPSYLLLLYRVAEQEDPAGVGALQGLGYLGDPRAVPRLLDQLGSKDRSRQAVANGALELITGHHEDPEESLLRSRWVTWWSHNAPRFKDGLRYRHGQLLDPGQLIERLDHDDAFVRRSTYDELVISTGCRLPFDAEGPYRVQVAHRRAWAQWWQDNAANFPAGRWSFHGELLG